MKPKKIISALIGACEIGNKFEIEGGIGYQSFGLPPSSIIFSGENLTKFHDLIDKLYRHSSAIHETLTLKKFTGALVEKFKDDFENNSPPDDSKIEEFFDGLKSEPIVEYYIFREIFGIKFNSDIPFVEFGDFTVYNFQNHKQPISDLANGRLENDFTRDGPQYLVRFNAKARHFEKAIEIADIFLKRFEATLNFCAGRSSKQIEIGIFNYLGWQVRRSLVLSENGIVSRSHKSEGPISEAPVDDPYFKEPKNGFDKIWTIITKNKLSEIESKIILSIDWIGQSTNERSSTDAFLKAAIALEVLLTYNDKVPITPSLTYRLSESSALILGKKMSDRIKIERKIKSLYSRRSSIVHAGKHSVEKKEISHMQSYVRAIIMELLTDPNLCKIKTTQTLYDYLREVKYS